MTEDNEELEKPIYLIDNLGEFHEETYMQIWACEYDRTIKETQR